jgi:chromosomal replication initiator protein
MKTLFQLEQNHTDEDQTAETLSPEKTLHKGWQLLLLELQNQLDPQDFEDWILPLRNKILGPNHVALLVPDLVFYRHIIKHHLPLIEACKQNLGLTDLAIQLEVEHGDLPQSEESSMDADLAALRAADSEAPPPTKRSHKRSEKHSAALPLNETRGDKGNANEAHEGAESHAGEEESVDEDSEEKHPEAVASPYFSSALPVTTKLNPNYTFETFVRGPSNQFALASCLHVAENPGKNYNPLFLYGSTGLGKTHLLHAVGNRVLQENPGSIVSYISSERFMNEMVFCIRHNKMWDFRQKYRNCDVFMMDDIQFISGNKATTQEEFFHTFNCLYEAKKQIIITSDLFPQDIADIEERLRNRFQWGLIADIQPPDMEHRIAILKCKADKLNVHLSDEIAEYIALNAKRNVRELEGALHRIVAFAALQGRSLDKAIAMETFHSMLGEAPQKVEIEMVQKTVADHFKIRLSDLRSKKRHRALTLPRQIAMYLARNSTLASFPEIGAKFGGKDHSTVMHAVKKIAKDKSTDLDLKAHLETLERHLEQLQF